MTEQLRNVFKQMDVDEDGMINREEASFAIQLLGHKADVPAELFKKMDADKDDHINFDEFVKLADAMQDVIPFQPIRRMSRQFSNMYSSSPPSSNVRKMSLVTDK